MKKKVTIYDVAEEAGVSLATVSRVINGSNVVKPQTRDKVLAIIQRLDFKPNQVARGLATSKTTTIAIVFPQSLFAHVKNMIGGIGDTSRRLDYNISIYTTDSLGEENTIEDVIEKVIKSRADGVVLFNSDRVDEQIELCKKNRIPTVVIGKKIDNEAIGSIYVDAKKITYDLISSYLDKNKKDILFVKTKQNLVDTSGLVEGIKEAYKDHGLTFNDDCILNTSLHYEKSYPQLKDYFKDKKHDLVFTSYDKEAVAVVNAAIENGINVPNEMEVIGMMDTSYSIMCRPALSSIHVSVYDMGALAIRLLTKMLNDEEIETKEVSLNYVFMKRDTTI
jgi:LacI family transcriptional regulator